MIAYRATLDVRSELVQFVAMHDITAARAHALPALYHAAAAGLPTLADPGYEGAGIGILIPVKPPSSGQELDLDTRTRNAIQRSDLPLPRPGVPSTRRPPGASRGQ